MRLYCCWCGGERRRHGISPAIIKRAMNIRNLFHCSKKCYREFSNWANRKEIDLKEIKYIDPKSVKR